MKYIRTKDGIYEILKETNKEYWVDIPNELFRWIEKDNEQIIKQADTIEELCDEFVLLDKYSNPFFISYCGDNKYVFKYDEQPYEYEINGGEEIFGAIWTDKGLIYVAKMNDKGELELI